MLKSITITLASIGVMTIADCTRADLGHNSSPRQPDPNLYTQVSTKLNKPIIYKSKLGNQIFSTQKTNLKPSAKKPALKNTKGMSIQPQSKNLRDCQRMHEEFRSRNNTGSLSTSGNIENLQASTCSYEPPKPLPLNSTNPQYPSAQPFPFPQQANPINGLQPNTFNSWPVPKERSNTFNDR